MILDTCNRLSDNYLYTFIAIYLVKFIVFKSVFVDIRNHRLFNWCWNCTVSPFGWIDFRSKYFDSIRPYIEIRHLKQIWIWIQLVSFPLEWSSSACTALTTPFFFEPFLLQFCHYWMKTIIFLLFLKHVFKCNNGVSTDLIASSYFVIIYRYTCKMHWYSRTRSNA